VAAPDISKFLPTFRAEAQDHITQLETGLVRLEKNPKDVELINLLNRAAHTLKGAARMMGFNDITDVAHRIEDTFAAIEDKEYEFTSKIADKVFKDLDTIKGLLEKLGAGGEKTKNQEEKIKPPPDSNPVGGERAERVPSGVEGEFIRVPLSRINTLMNLAGEMVINKVKAEYKISMVKKLSKLAKESQKELAAVTEGNRQMHQLNVTAEKVKTAIITLADNISAEALHLDPIVAELQETARQLRMLPMDTVFDTYPRLIRDIAQSQHKTVDFDMSGKETEIDKKILEGISPALIHLLRNCVDHGIEKTGQVTLSAWHEGGNVVIEVADDGVGLDLDNIKATALKKKVVTSEEMVDMSEKEIMNLIFLPGFSTLPIITDVSGRGVGLDVVKVQVEKLRGEVILASSPGRGTTITLKLPLTVAIIQALMVKIETMTFAFPLLAITEAITVTANDINTIEGKSAISLRGHPVPLVPLSDLLALPKNPTTEKTKKKLPSVMLLSPALWVKKIGFMVDEVMGEDEIYLKSLGNHLGRIKNIEGATILGSGEVVIVLDVPDLIESAKSVRAAPTMVSPTIVSESKKKILIVEDSFTTRELERSILEAQGYDIATAIDGLEAIDKISQAKPDLIVADIQMPRMDGFEMCRTLKKNDEYKDIPVVMVTALEKEEDKRRGIEVGAEAYITKTSFDQKNLLETIERLIG